ncbi:MAG TPA: hypothetical protein VGF08_03010 [Terriglobales bacterium]
MTPKPGTPELVKGIGERLRGSDAEGRESDSKGPMDIVEILLRTAVTLSKHGITTAIFALPLVVACFGLYFLWIATTAVDVNTTKVEVGIFTIVFGSGLLILLLWLFNKLDIGKKLREMTAVKGKKAA